ncbi:hypothetical protein BDB00DRAFT_953602 [Zychaea mexicana]|uniref:uncharacterized protein n=1 Tax=Zychaea mexicana TaxID=64656 RepID=UPI0022FEC022|nr:uncharacterized protein BDB00DRAFT_953602 [Zychaea mexicana]KAI9495968.1 hypothetical protein BDB00DRAFT_953602 [Zychaea mexicana]
MRAQNGHDIHFRYKLAKCLTFVSLIAVITMALSSFLYPGRLRWTAADDDEDNSYPQADTAASSSRDCSFKLDTLIPQSPDGSYTPPPPDETLLRAVELASNKDYQNYCQSWDEVNGFADNNDNNELDDDGCGVWQQKYLALHEQRLEQLQRLKAGDFESFGHESKPEYVSYLCESDPQNRGSHGCGGLADRMNGMVSTFFYGLLTDRAYLAHWEDPLPLETLFEKPSIDWSFDPKEMRELFDKKEDADNNDYLSYKKVNTLNQKWGPIGRTMFPHGATQDFKDLWNASYVEWHGNRAFVIRTFRESSIYPEKLNQLGLTKENSFRCIMDYLFRPTIGARQFINAYKNMFEMDSILSIGLQIRTGDSGIVNPGDDLNTLQMWDYFMICANQLREAKREPHHKQVVYFLITDSVRLRDEFVSLNHDKTKAQQFLGDNHQDVTMVVTGLPIEHVESKTIKPKFLHNITKADLTEDEQNTLAGVNAAVIENWLLSFTDYRLISRQGFGKLSAFHSKSSHTTIGMPKLSRKQVAVNCANPHAFITFDTLSTWWSLG